jgi:proteasome lid subunit RPN8/RPN11
LTRKKRRKRKPPSASGDQPAEDQGENQVENQGEPPSGEGQEDAPEDVKVTGWMETDVEPRRKRFPDPRRIDEPLRIAMTAEASAEMVAHAKESLDAEVCGVLVGELCEDDQGIWVSVRAAIRGTSTKQGGAHVTYTQETWDKVYEEKDRDYPKLNIVGWYHSHPGFGVAFSDMDQFIQENFFPGTGQFALVLDPLAGDEAICANGPDGIEHVSRFWVDGRERTCRIPPPERSRAKGKAGASGEAGEAASDVADRLKAVEDRLQQVLQATDQDRLVRHRVHLIVGMLLALAIVLWISFMVYDRVYPSHTPPKQVTWSKLPVMIGDKVALVGVQVVSWELPPELHAKFIEAVIEQIQAAEKAQQEVQEKAEKQEKAGRAKSSGQKAKPKPP